MPKIIPFPRRRRWTRPSAYGRFERRPSRSAVWLRYVPLWAAAILGGTIYGAGLLDGAGANASAMIARTQAAMAIPRFGFCHTGGGKNCVVDGDTIWLDGEKIRIVGIDAPETHPPRCAHEAELGRAATVRLRQLLNSGAVTTSSIDRDEDRYGRKLRNVQVDGLDVGDTLISEGLARPYGSGRRPWC